MQQQEGIMLPELLGPVQARPHHSFILGVARVQVKRAYHHLLPLPTWQREQYNVWSGISDDDLVGKLFCFHALSVHLLPAPVPLQQSYLRFHGLVNELEHGQPQRLLELLPLPLPVWLAQAATPCIALRAPAPHMVCVASGAWDMLWLPGESEHRAFRIAWAKLRLQRPAALPQYVTAACALPLDRTMASSVCDVLRHFVSDRPAAAADDAAEMARCYAMALSLQNCCDESCPSGLVRNIKARRHH